jgi:chaperonin GroEL
VAVIKVGGATETEIGEKKYRVDDAVAATKAALAGGIVPGGGVTLVNLAGTIKSDEPGHQIVKTALVEPFVQLMRNAGLNAESKLEKVREAKAGQGFDVNAPSKLVDLKAVGIIDPAAVTREAIANSVSISATAITMGALVVDIPEKEAPAAPPAMGGGMGMM